MSWNRRSFIPKKWTRLKSIKSAQHSARCSFCETCVLNVPLAILFACSGSTQKYSESRTSVAGWNKLERTLLRHIHAGEAQHANQEYLWKN